MHSPLRQEGFAKASARRRMILPCDYVILISKTREPPKQIIPRPKKIYMYLPSTSLIYSNQGLQPRQRTVSVNEISRYSALCLLFSAVVRSKQRMA